MTMEEFLQTIRSWELTARDPKFGVTVIEICRG